MGVSGTSGAAANETEAKLRSGKVASGSVGAERAQLAQESDEKARVASTGGTKAGATTLVKVLLALESTIGPVALTLLAFYTRFKQIGRAKSVIWDEAHFGKFGSYYIKGEFYHDVHPPLGKMLIGLSEWLAGFDGDFGFDSGKEYPENCDYVTMRYFNAAFSALCVPLTYYAAKVIGFNLLSVYLVSLMVCFESSYIVLGKFILLDSMLLFFTITTFFTLVKLHDLKKRRLELSWTWYKWMLLTGLSIGCVCSVKWVGLFITAVVGLYTVQDLFEKLYEPKMTWKTYSKHWLVRIVSLIVVPFVVYLICFKIHFGLLYKSGTGDASTSSLFQAHLEGSSIGSSPRDVLFGSEVTIRSHGLSPNLLHSHGQIYPDGSNQQQVTGYGHSDANNNWIIKPSRRSGLSFEEAKNLTEYLKDGDIIRLGHKMTGANLHSHEIPGHVTKKAFEVSGYGSEVIGDTKDDWVVEIVRQVKSPNASYHNEDTNTVHTLSTSFRLKHADMGCYLATTGLSYPSWGFKQSEVVCKDSWSKRDKSTWWNIEATIDDRLTVDEHYTPPRSGFWEDFILINFAMAASNSALVPDEDKYDNLASSYWEWPTLHTGLRMCGWGEHNVRYYLLGSVLNTWLSTAAVLVLPVLCVGYAALYQRQALNWTKSDFDDFVIQAVYPFIAWLLHYLPFVIMGRVTYVHHYVPALFFALFVLTHLIDKYVGALRPVLKYPIYGLLFGVLVFNYFFFAPFYDGMTGPLHNYDYLNLLSSWTVV